LFISCIFGSFFCTRSFSIVNLPLPAISRALLFANGDPHPGAMVTQALAAAPDALLIAADGGARVAQFFGCPPHIIIGDMDSLTPDEITRFTDAGAVLQRHPADKNETDLELALVYAVGQGVTWLRIMGAVGSRFDQTLANMHLLTLPALAAVDAAIVAGQQAIFVLRPGTHRLLGAAGDTVSLLPLYGDVTDIRTEALKYPLHGETLAFGPARGVSNVMLESEASVSFVSGLLLVVHTMGRA
jgi:thiamine pyrophosphokinase